MENVSNFTVAGHVFAQSHIPYESAPTGYGRGQTDVPSYCPCHHRFLGVFAEKENGIFILFPTRLFS